MGGSIAFDRKGAGKTNERVKKMIEKLKKECEQVPRLTNPQSLILLVTLKDETVSLLECGIYLAEESEGLENP